MQLVNLFQDWPLIIRARLAALKEFPDIDLKEVRPWRAKELLNVVETLSLGLWHKEEAEEESEDGDASKDPEGASLR